MKNKMAEPGRAGAGRTTRRDFIGRFLTTLIGASEAVHSDSAVNLLLHLKRTWIRRGGRAA
jgi:hypothetical protein